MIPGLAVGDFFCDIWKYVVNCAVMARKHKIYEDDWRYNLLHWLVATYVHHSFRRMVCRGKENLPKDGAIILAPNHCNTLMDPFALLGTLDGKMVFVARADIFATKFAGVLRFLKMLPINRKRDGIRNMVKTDETIKNSIEVLNNSTPFCILPEGTHRTMHSLMPIGKGIVRIATGAIEASGGKKVYIVPIGLEYGDYFRYRSTLVVEYGKPIDVNAVEERMKDETPLALNNEIRSLTRDGIKRNIVYIPDDENYDAKWELCKIYSSKVQEVKPLERREANKEAAAKLEKLSAEQPEKAAALFERSANYKKAREESKISGHVVKTRRKGLVAVLSTLLMAVLSPIEAVWALASSIPVALAEFICWKGADRAFNNSLRCAALMFIWTLVWIVWAVVLLVCLPWWVALVIIVGLVPAPFMVYDYVEAWRRVVSLWKCLWHKKLCKEHDALRREMEKL